MEVMTCAAVKATEQSQHVKFPLSSANEIDWLSNAAKWTMLVEDNVGNLKPEGHFAVSFSSFKAMDGRVCVLHTIAASGAYMPCSIVLYPFSSIFPIMPGVFVAQKGKSVDAEMVITHIAGIRQHAGIGQDEKIYLVLDNLFGSWSRIQYYCEDDGIEIQQTPQYLKQATHPISYTDNLEASLHDRFRTQVLSAFPGRSISQNLMEDVAQQILDVYPKVFTKDATKKACEQTIFAESAEKFRSQATRIAYKQKELLGKRLNPNKAKQTYFYGVP